MKNGLLLALIALTGCATLERHPIATAVIAGVIVGTIATQDHGRHDGVIPAGPSICRVTPVSCY